LKTLTKDVQAEMVTPVQRQSDVQQEQPEPSCHVVRTRTDTRQISEHHLARKRLAAAKG
jgi:hypothetical protein